MQIFATHSFRGGSGKSFVALNMAAQSARKGVKTIIMDCDFGSPSFQSSLISKIKLKKFGNDFLLGTAEVPDVISPTNIAGLDAIYANPHPVLGKGLLDPSETIHWTALKHFSKLREKLEKEGYKRLFLDSTPDLSYQSISALTVADSILLVHRPVLHTVDMTIYILQTIYSALKKSLKPRNFYVIYNQVPHGSNEKVMTLLDSVTEELRKTIDIRVLGHISLDPTMDFWDSLIIREGNPLLSKLDQMLASISKT